MSLLQKLSMYALDLGEKVFLKAHGWKRIAENSWCAPHSYPFRNKHDLNQAHAVNAMKQYTHRHRSLWPIFEPKEEGETGTAEGVVE